MKNKTADELKILGNRYTATNPQCSTAFHFVNGYKKCEEELLPVINKLQEENSWVEVSATSPKPEYNKGLLVIVSDGGYDFAVPAMLDAGSGQEKWIKLEDYTDLEAPQAFEGDTDYPKVTHWRYAPANPVKNNLDT